jgi:hypothetical protein
MVIGLTPWSLDPPCRPESVDTLESVTGPSSCLSFAEDNDDAMPLDLSPFMMAESR